MFRGPRPISFHICIVIEGGPRFRVYPGPGTGWVRPWVLTIRIAPQRPKMDVQLNSFLAQHSVNLRRSWLITFDRKQLDLIIHIIINKTCAALRPHQLHERPFRLAKDHVQPLAAQDSPLPDDKKILI